MAASLHMQYAGLSGQLAGDLISAQVAATLALKALANGNTTAGAAYLAIIIRSTERGLARKLSDVPNPAFGTAEAVAA